MITLRTEQQSEEILVQREALIWAAVSYVHFQNVYCHVLKFFYEGKDMETDLLEEKDFECSNSQTQRNEKT